MIGCLCLTKEKGMVVKMMNSKKNNLVPRIILVVAANLLLALGIGLMRLSGFGTDPFTCMNLGVSGILGLGLGIYQMLFNIVLFIPVFILDRKSFGIGALINMLVMGYFIQFWMLLFSVMGITIEGFAENLAARILLLMAGILVACYGVGLYMFCDLGAAPYDRLGVVIETYSHGKIKFRWARVTMDLISIAIGFLTGSVVGVGTVVMAFFTGPIVTFFRERLISPMVKKMGVVVSD